MNALKENINNHYKVKIVGEAAAAGESHERWASPIRGRITCLEVNIPNEGHRRLRTSSSRAPCVCVCVRVLVAQLAHALLAPR